MSLDEMKAAVHRQDAALLRDVFARHPELAARVDEPVFAFDSPAICHARTREVLDVLLDAGADVNARSSWWAGGFGLLDLADAKLSAYAIGRGATLTAHAAARLGRLDALRALVAADPTAVHARGGDGQTPLHFAGTVEVAAFLLEHGADVDALDVDHESTPAQFMVRDRPDVARYLVSRGCQTDILLAAALGDLPRVKDHLARDPSALRRSVTEANFPQRDPRAGGTIYLWTLGRNKTPHAVARAFGHEDVYQYLMDQSPDELKFAQACELGDVDTFNAYLAARPDLVKSLDAADLRKLPDAAQDNNAAAVRLMLSAGWPVGARGQHGGTALHWAAWHGNAEVVREILHHTPALDDAENDFKAAPLGWATHGSEHGWHAKTGDYATTVELLCAAGAPVPRVLSGTGTVREVLRLCSERTNAGRG